MDEFFWTKPASGRVRRVGSLVFLAWVSTVVLLPGNLFALNTQTTIERKGLILAMNRPLDSEAEHLFQSVVAQTIRWGLERQKLGVIETTALPSESTSFQHPAEVLDPAITEEIDFILLTEYASRGRELEIHMAWYDPQSGEKTEEVIRRGPKDLVLDRIIREALNELLEAVQSSLDTLQPRQIQVEPDSGTADSAGFRPGAGGNNGPIAEGSVAQNQPRIGGGDSSDALPSPRTPESVPGAVVEGSRQDRKRHVDLGLGCAPFVATGAASDYFKLGIMPLMNLSYLFQGDISRFGVGLYGGVNAFTATGDLGSAQTFLIPVGISLRYEIGGERYPSAVFGIASGPALMMMSGSTGEPLLGITFFGRGMMGVRLPIGRTFAFLIEAGYDVYWEKPQPIMGFSPAVSTTVRL